MFTGLIIELGEIVSIERRSDSAKVFVKGIEVAKDASLGDSIAINGVCLTVVSIDKDTFSFDVSYETLRSTNIGALKRGDRVNLEPALMPHSKMGGHFVTGHVEGIGIIRAKTSVGNAIKIEIEVPANILMYLVEKGSVAVDGISLTVADVLKNAFSVVIIPHTAKLTTIGFKRIGDTVNLEPDILGKYVINFLQKNKDTDSSLISALKKSGYIS
jgi:riboflavin synthase